MKKDPKDLYNAISKLTDLKAAIKTVKKAMSEDEESSSSSSSFAKSESKPASTEVEPKQHGLAYLGRKLANGKITHLIGTGNDADHHYELEVDLHKHHKGLPCIILSHVSPKGELEAQHNQQHENLKSAIDALMHHHTHKAWKKDEQE